MARFADAAVVRALIKADAIDWQRLMEPKDKTLYLAALRLKYDRDGETFMLLVRNLIEQQANEQAADEKTL